MILNENDKSKAVSLIYSFSKIMRQTLESSYLEKHSINDEVIYLKEYLELNLLDNPIKYSYDFYFENINDLDEIEIPIMLIQPFVENTIEHGFSNINYLGKIEIIFCKKDINLEIRVKDNGGKSSKNIQNHTPRALQIITDRLYLLNQNNKQKANFHANFSVNGAEVIINLPL
jgi:LytS/YehU family sensor histidine kinase